MNKSEKQSRQVRKNPKRESYSWAVNGVGSNELLDIGGRPGGEGLITLDESGIVVQEGKPLTPELLVALPVPLEERLLRFSRSFSHFSSII